MKFGLRVPACRAPQDVADLIARAEQGGFDVAWMPDTQLLNRDVWITLAVAAARTSRIALGTNVTNPVTRHATVTASAAATMDELSGGRFILGIGTGESSVRVMGWPIARLAELREYIALLRPLWEGRWIAPYGPAFHLQYASGRRVPVYIAATRPKMLQLAGEIADGVIMMTGISPAALDYGLSHIERGARRAGRQLADLDIAVGAYCHITDDWRTIKRLAQPYAALYALRYRGTDRDFGIDIPADFGISSLYPDLLHAEDWDAAIAATSWVPDSVLEAFCEEWVLMGTGDQVAARIRQLAAHGVRHLYIRHFFTYDLPLDVCAALATEVIPRFR